MGDNALFKRASLAVTAALLLVGLAGRPEATVMVDPGPVGGQSNVPLVPDAMFPGGQSTSFHYVFEDMKQVAATRWGWLISNDFDPGTSWTVAWLFYLTDMSGNEISGTRSIGDEVEPLGFLRNSTDPIVAHGIFVELFPRFESNPNQNLIANISVDGIVGEGAPGVLPQPAAITLFGFGLAGLGWAIRRRKRAATR